MNHIKFDRKTTILYMITVHLISLSTHAAPPTSAVNEDIFSIVNLRSRAPAIVENESGLVRTLIGEFKAGLTPDMIWDHAAVSIAIKDFVTSNKMAFIGPHELAELRIARLDDIDGREQVATIEQFVHGLRLSESQVTAVFSRSGNLMSLDGAFRHSIAVDEIHPRSANEISDIISAQLPAAITGQIEVIVGEIGQDIAFDDIGAQLERIVDPTNGLVLWELRGPINLTIDESSGAIIRQNLNQDSIRTSCSVLYEDFYRDGNGKATGLDNTSDANGNPAESPTCEADDVFGTCTWMLKFDEWGTESAISRIENDGGSEVSDIQACSSTSTPTFSAVGGAAEQQQISYVGVQGARHFIFDNVWNAVAPQQTDSVHPHVNGNPACGACFDDFWHSIESTSTFAYRQSTWWHEYGHYVVWSYGDVSDNCSSSDQGDPIDETIANCFAMLVAVDDPDVDPRYGALGAAGTSLRSLSNGQAPPAHGPGSAIALPTNWASICDNPADMGDHTLGRAFEQVIWELLWNDNCNINNCGTSKTFGNFIWPGASQETVLQNVGAALGGALAVTGQNTTFQALAQQFINRVAQSSGSTIANRVDAVFAHHGM